MKSTLINSLNIFVICLLLLVGCKKNSDSPSGANNYASPTIAKDTLIKIPEAMKTKAESDQNLTLGVTEIEMINIFTTGLAGAFWYDQGTVDGWQATSNSDGSTTYNWKYLQYSINLTYYHSNSESWWKYSYDSATYKYPIYYINDKGSSGEIAWYGQKYYKSNPLLIYKDVWSKTTDTKTSTFTWFKDDGVTAESQYVSTSKTDKSGTLKVYEANDSGVLKLQWSYIWDKTGAGSYIHYKSDGTTIDFQGTF